MRKRNVILFPSVPFLNHPSVPLSSSHLLALRMQHSNRFFGQDYTFFVHQISSLVSPTSFSGPKKRPGTTTHLEWFQGIVQHLCGTYPRVVVRVIQLTLVHTSCRFLTKLCDQVVALISDQHSEELVFKSDTEHVDVDFGDSDAVDDSDRLYHFEVQQTRQQEDSATASKGFKVISMGHLKAISDCS